jgi:hypothetical protein
MLCRPALLSSGICRLFGAVPRTVVFMAVGGASEKSPVPTFSTVDPSVFGYLAAATVTVAALPRYRQGNKIILEFLGISTGFPLFFCFWLLPQQAVCKVVKILPSPRSTSSSREARQRKHEQKDLRQHEQKDLQFFNHSTHHICPHTMRQESSDNGDEFWSTKQPNRPRDRQTCFSV